MTADLVAELVAASWTPPFEQPLLRVPGDRRDARPVWDAIAAGAVADRGDGVLIPGPTHPDRVAGRAVADSAPGETAVPVGAVALHPTPTGTPSEEPTR